MDLQETFLLCLNPYSTGNEVVGQGRRGKEEKTSSLNPYSTGNEVVGDYLSHVQNSICLQS